MTQIGFERHTEKMELTKCHNEHRNEGSKGISERKCQTEYVDKVELIGF